MFRFLDNSNIGKVVLLLKSINLGIKSMINDYAFLYTESEIVFLNKISELLCKMINKIEKNNYNIKEIIEILQYEKKLKPYAFRTWNYEYQNGKEYISWFKYDKLVDTPPIVSSTFGFGDSFCESRYGISYQVNIDGFLGACNKDAATLIEKADRRSIYTIGKTSDARVVNSYNLATPIITPIQIFDKTDNSYKSKHNEVILDSRYIIPIKVVYTNSNDLKMVNAISLKYNIPIELKKNSYTK